MFSWIFNWLFPTKVVPREPVDLDRALRETAEVKEYCVECKGVGECVPKNDCRSGAVPPQVQTCQKCEGMGYTVLKLGATDIVKPKPKEKGKRREYENILGEKK